MLSESAANTLLGWSNGALIVGAALVALGTIGAIWTTKVREQYAERRLGRAEGEIVVARESATQANEDAARARAEQAKLRSQLQGRQLTREQYEKIVIALRPSKGQTVTLTFVSGDQEVKEYTDQLVYALSSAGIIVKVGALMSPDSHVGIVLSNHGTPQVESLKAALNTAGIEWVSGPTTGATIFVGYKPTLR